MKNHVLFVHGQLFCPGDLVLILSEVLKKKACPTCRIEMKR